MTLPTEALPLAAGTVLALIALTVVLAPLMSSDDEKPEAPSAVKVKDPNAEGTAIAALREIEFDKATGKLSDKDYDSLRAMYTRDALAELRAADNLATNAAANASGPVTDDMVEAAIRRAKNATHDCTVCGSRRGKFSRSATSCGGLF
ncbi:MAG: hypothetical protein ABI852_20060, partial [Gemmatimonadaceae bacterium]